MRFMNLFIDFTMELVLYFLVIVEWFIILGLAGLAVYGIYKGIKAIWKLCS